MPQAPGAPAVIRSPGVRSGPSLVPAAQIHGELVAAFSEQARAIRTSFEGGRCDADALVPPVNDGNQLQRVLGFIDRLPGEALGLGKDLSMYGLEVCTRIKHVIANIES